MSIRIVNGGNSAVTILSFDECIIESVFVSEENVDHKSFVKDMCDGSPIYKRMRSDAEVEDFINEMHENDEIADVVMDEKNHDVIIMIRQLGEEPIDVGEISCNE